MTSPSIEQLIGEDSDGRDCGVALCLSGGGYRAMLFHLGALWRLNEIGWLPRLDRVSSVSGGSITAGVLAARWGELRFDARGVGQDFQSTVAADLHRLAGKTIDVWAVLGGVFGPGAIGDRVAAAYRRHLFGRKTLQDLPDRPRFIFLATNLQSGVLWRFSKPYMADYRVGMVRRPDVQLATAVAASSAFPPVLSPLTLRLDPQSFDENFQHADLDTPPYTTKAILSDGGVYDNLGLEPVDKCKTMLISDGGGHLEANPKPPRFWPLQLFRVLKLMDNQVRALRKRHEIEAFNGPDQEGVYWGIRTPIADYRLVDALAADPERTVLLAATPTRLGKLALNHQRRLVNWGYAICDAGMRSFIDRRLPRPDGFPYPEVPI